MLDSAGALNKAQASGWPGHRLLLLVETPQSDTAEPGAVLHFGQGFMEFDHRLLRRDLGGHRARQGVESLLTDGGGQTRFLAAPRQGLGQLTQTLNGLILSRFCAVEGALKARRDHRGLFGSFHGHVSDGPASGSASVPQVLQKEGELLRAGKGCYDPDDCGGDAEDEKDASEPPMFAISGLKFTSSIAAAM